MEKAQFEVYNKIDPDADIRVVFDQKNPNWSYAPEYNHHFVRVMMDHLQHKLMIQGYLFVNDVLFQLGIDRLPEGQLLGWYNPGQHLDRTVGLPDRSRLDRPPGCHRGTSDTPYETSRSR